MLLLFLLFLGTLHLLARRLYGTAVATVSVGLLALGSREQFGHELVAQGNGAGDVQIEAARIEVRIQCKIGHLGLLLSEGDRQPS